MSSVARIGDPIGPLVKFQRLQAGMTQNQLCDHSGIELTRLAAFEAGHVRATDGDVQAITEALGIDRETLLANLPEGLILTIPSDLSTARKPQTT